MCYQVVIASPLTLSEVLAMLPSGLAADLLGPAEHRAFRRAHPEAQTVARLVRGACSCDLMVERQPVARQDEAWLRRRYRAQGLPREAVIQALDIHRRAGGRRHPSGYWPRVVAEFVAEHARNAGPTLYYLYFSPDGSLGPLPDAASLRLSPGEVRRHPAEWLQEGRLLLVAETDTP